MQLRRTVQKDTTPHLHTDTTPASSATDDNKTDTTEYEIVTATGGDAMAMSTPVQVNDVQKNTEGLPYDDIESQALSTTGEQVYENQKVEGPYEDLGARPVEVPNVYDRVGN